MGPKPLAIVAVVSLALFILACGKSEQPEAGSLPTSTLTPLPTQTPTPTPTPIPTPTPRPTPPPFDPEAILDRSGQVMQALKYFHFRLHHESGGTQLLPGLVIDEAEGDVINPGALSVEFNGTFGQSIAVKASVITLGNQTYMTNPLTGQWEVAATSISPLGFFNPSQGITSMMSQVTGVHEVEDGGGAPDAYVIGGSLPVEALAPLLGPTLGAVSVRVELTIDADRLHLLRVRVSGKVTQADADDVVRVITLSAFDEAITIDAPL
jgi:hypothetical protein